MHPIDPAAGSRPAPYHPPQPADIAPPVASDPAATGSPLRDLRWEPKGGFAGPIAPDAAVGTFGGGVRRFRDGVGGFAGDADGRRQGSFADVDGPRAAPYELPEARTLPAPGLA